MKKTTVFLSRRNLEVLLSKLARKAAGESTFCTIIKYKNPSDPPEYAQKLDEIEVVAVEDADYYQARSAGVMLQKDEPSQRETGATFVAPDLVLEAFEKEMVGYQYGEDARSQALAWFRKGYEAR